MLKLLAATAESASCCDTSRDAACASRIADAQASGESLRLSRWINRGATTLWETWSGDSSLNHHAFSDVSAWLYRGLAGLRPDPAEPGFRHFTVRPHPVGDLRWVKARHGCPYGLIAIAWERGDRRFELDLTVPVGTRATVELPADAGSRVLESAAPAAGQPGVVSVSAPVSGRVTVELASGRYRLEAQVSSSSVFPAGIA